MALLPVLLSGCASLLPSAPVPAAGAAAFTQNAWAQQSSAAGAPGGGWQHYKLPGKKPTQFSYDRKDGRDSLAARAVSSASMLRRTVRLEPAALGKVRFSWKVPELIAHADMGTREGDDSPVRIILAFEGDRSRFSARDAMLSELALALTGEPMPYATLMYVWCNQRTPGTVIRSPRTDRIRKLVVQTGPQQLDQWLDYERDIGADFRHAFGEPPGALVAIGIMTDTDNTRSTATAWYGAVRLAAKTPLLDSRVPDGGSHEPGGPPIALSLKKTPVPARCLLC